MSFKVETMDDLRRLLITAEGGDPEAQQTLNAFIKFNNIIERTNLPTRRDVVLEAYLSACGNHYFPGSPDDPFTTVAHCIATAFMAKGGDKSKQFVELMKQTPSLVDLQTLGQEPPKGGLFDRLRGRTGEP